ncbi:UPF0327 protein C1orf151-like [Nesidiocoris tenuis]|uniref:MICOS complex subunit MIC10 n=1 Tax=Nesidiocoris tenuis TaxID=355587 RepID=A0ABN7A604_9HEMI|nr:UPF0327 protein C1orf151-like [Nesidiocoris tenuis]
MNAPSHYEDHVKWRFTRCVNDIAVKSVAATAFSVLGAKFFFKKVPVSSAAVVGLGTALGMTYKNCEREMQLSLTSEREQPPQVNRSRKDECIKLKK